LRELGTLARGEGSVVDVPPEADASGGMALEKIRAVARSGGVVGGELDNLLLVAAELLSNAVDHGGGGGAVHEPGDEGARMRLALRVAGGSWRLEVSDEGGGDAATVRELIQPNGLPDLEDERGRGFFLIGQMVDEIGVQATSDGRGLTLRCVRRLPG
jgi:anti-sigma regulatory factor (Ser/Thr protein kinase)